MDTLIRLEELTKRYDGARRLAPDLRRPASCLDVYRALELVVLALAGVLITAAGALALACWAARIRTATALHAE